MPTVRAVGRPRVQLHQAVDRRAELLRDRGERVAARTAYVEARGLTASSSAPAVPAAPSPSAAPLHLHGAPAGRAARPSSPPPAPGPERRSGRTTRGSSPSRNRPDLAAQAQSAVVLALAIGIDDRTRCCDERAGRSARERSGHVSGFRSWAPRPGSNNTDCGSSLRASATARGCVAPMTAPTLDRPRSPTTSAPHSATCEATCCQSVRPSERTRSWISPPPGSRSDDAEDPAAVRRQAARYGSTESRPRYGFTSARQRPALRPHPAAPGMPPRRRAAPMSPRFVRAPRARPPARSHRPLRRRRAPASRAPRRRPVAA